MTITSLNINDYSKRMTITSLNVNVCCQRRSNIIKYTKKDMLYTVQSNIHVLSFIIRYSVIKLTLSYNYARLN